MSDFIITASGIERLERCDSAIVLPRAQQTVREKPSLRGTAVHDFLLDVPLMGRELALAEVHPDYAELCGNIEVECLPAGDPEGYLPEVSFRYNVVTGEAEELSRRDGRRAYNDDGSGEWIYGTTDSIGLLDDWVVVYDYKTGRQELGPVKRIRQLRFYALAAARAYKKKRAKIAIIRIREDGSSWFDWGELTEADLEEVARELLALVIRVDTLRGQPPQLANATMGNWCKYCPSKGWCRAISGAAQDLIADSMYALGFSEDRVITVQNAPRVMQRTALYRAILDDAEAGCRTLAATEDIVLEDGWVLGMKECPDTVIDPEAALPLLAEAYGQDVADAALVVKTEITQAQLKRALKKAPPELVTKGKSGRPSQSAFFAEVFDGLKEQGAARVTKTMKVVKYKKRTTTTEEGSDGSEAD